MTDEILQRLDASIAWLRDGVPAGAGVGLGDLIAIRAALAQYPRQGDEDEAMAGCMRLLRSDLIEAGVITEKVPPMFMTEAILGAMVKGHRDAARLDWIEHALRNWGAVWFLPCGEEHRFLQIRGPSREHVTNFDLGKGLRDGIDAAMAAAIPSPAAGQPKE